MECPSPTVKIHPISLLPPALHKHDTASAGIIPEFVTSSAQPVGNYLC